MSSASIIAWHGSPYTFDRFDFSKLRDGLGVFFTADKAQAEHHGTARQYRLTFRNILRVHQGEEYSRWLARREEETERDVRRRLMRDGYDGVRIEYHGGVVDYVAFSNRSIMAINLNASMQIPSEANQANIPAKARGSFAHRTESKRLLDLAKHAVEVAIERGEETAMDLLVNHEKIGI